MSTNPPLSKRTKYDLDSTFDVLVGDAESQKRFTLHTNVFIPRSEFFRAARSSQWLSDPQKPVDLEDESANIFSLYMNCVYFGIEVLRVEALEADEEGDDSDDSNDDEHENANDGDATDGDDNGKDQAKLLDPGDSFEHSETECKEICSRNLEQRTEHDVQTDQQVETLVKVYLLADRLQDMTTANNVIDELVRVCEKLRRNPGSTDVALAYTSTIHGHPLRKFLRDCYVYEHATIECMGLHDDRFPKDFYRDIAVEYMRHKDDNTARRVYDVYRQTIVNNQCAKDSCHYHQHDDKHPRCVPKAVLDG